MKRTIHYGEFVFEPSKEQMESIENYCKKRGITEKTHPGWLLPYKRLDEDSLNRMLSHGKTGMVIISGNREKRFSDNANTSLGKEYNDYLNESGKPNTPQIQKEWLADRNKRADIHLERDIQSAGYSYTPVYAGYHGTDSVIDSFEPSFEPSYVVYNHSRKGTDDYGDFNELYKFAITMCCKYKLDSVYIQAPNQAPFYVDCNGNKVSGSSNLSFIKNNLEQEHSIGFGECYVRKALTYEYVDRMRRSQLGEIFLG